VLLRLVYLTVTSAFAALRLLAVSDRDEDVEILALRHHHGLAAAAGCDTARPHQGIAQRVPDDERDTDPATVTSVDIRQIHRKPVLNGLINEYVRAA
jgi:hypothetical protein